MNRKSTCCLAAGLAVVLAACSDDPTGPGEEVIAEHQETIEEILPEEMRNEMEDLGLEFNEGFEPPEFEGTYYVEPLFVDSNVPDEFAQPGQEFPEMYIRFSNQSEHNLHVDIDREEGGRNTSEGAGGYVIGEGNQLTVITEEIEEDDQGIRAEITMVYTGEISPDGLAEFELAGFVRDNHDRDDIIPNNTGRYFEAKDGLAEFSTWPESDEPSVVREASGPAGLFGAR